MRILGFSPHLSRANADIFRNNLQQEGRRAGQQGKPAESAPSEMRRGDYEFHPRERAPKKTYPASAGLALAWVDEAGMPANEFVMTLAISHATI